MMADKCSPCRRNTLLDDLCFDLGAFDSSPARKRTKVERSDSESQVDMFSDLPNPLIHHIMSSLPMGDATRMSVLSRRFLAAWRSLPVVDFDYASFCRSSTSLLPDFLAFVLETIRHRQSESSFLERLAFRLDYPKQIKNVPGSRSMTETVVNFAVESKVSELILECRKRCNIGCLPVSVFSSGSIRTMKLTAINLGNATDYVLSCPLMEVLSLVKCGCPSETTIKLSSARLKSARFHDCKGLEGIEIEGSAASLQSFSFCAAKLELPRDVAIFELQTFYWKKNHEALNCHKITNLGSCRSLNSLELERVEITDEWFEDAVSNSVRLEVLKLINCKGLKNVSLCNEHLQIMDLQDCRQIENVDVVAQNLKFFQHSLCDRNTPEISGKCRINIGGCKHLKDLRLTGIEENLTGQWIEEIFITFLFLEKLVLKGCDLLEEVKFRANYLKTLALIDCRNLRKAEINAPNLVSFIYRGSALPSPPLTVIPTNIDARLSLVFSDDTCQKLVRDFLSYFGHCKSLTLVSTRCEKLIFPDELRSSLVSPMHDLKHLKIRLIEKAPDAVELIDNLLWLAPRLETLSIAFDSKGSATLKFYYNPMLECPEEYKKNQPQCCISQKIKCWRHYLTRVEVETSEDFEVEEYDLRSFFTDYANATHIAVIKLK